MAMRWLSKRLLSALVASASLAAGAWLQSAAAAPPAIACRKATTSVEQEICNDPTLLAMDREIAALYDRGLAELSSGLRHQLVLSQQAFLEKRAGCNWAAHHSAHPGVAVEECVRGLMETRVRKLRTVADGAQF